MIKEVGNVLGISLKYATLKHAITNGLLRRTHFSLKKAMNVETGEKKANCHIYFNIAVPNHNTSNNTSIVCETSQMFQECIQHRSLDIKTGKIQQMHSIPILKIAQDLLEQTETIYVDAGNNAMRIHIRYHGYYEGNKRLRCDKTRICLGVTVENISSRNWNSIHTKSLGSLTLLRRPAQIILFSRKIGIDGIQFLHRMRLQSFTPREPIPCKHTTSQVGKLCFAVVIEQDELLATAGGSGDKKPSFDNDQDESDPTSSRQTALRFDSTTDIFSSLKEN